MNILQICHKPPFPPVDGGCIAMNNITQGLLQKGHRVKVLAISTQKHPYKVDAIPKEYLNQTEAEITYIDTNVTIGGALLQLLKNKSYHISRFYSSEFEKKIINTLTHSSFDIIHLESLFVTPYLDAIRKHTDSKIILRAHNVEYKIWQQNASTGINPLRVLYLKILAKQLKRYEVKLLNNYDGIATITLDDKQKYLELGCKIPIADIPLGLDVDEYKQKKEIYKSPKQELSIFHIGAMDWLPNRQGIKWFFDNVWQELSNSHPELKCYVAGRKMPSWLKQLKMNSVFVIEEVADAQEFMLSHGIMIVPLLSGGGLRVKIIEAMALGITVVSTATGASGIKCVHHKNILIANTPEEFINMIKWAISDTESASQIGSNAQKLASEYYDNEIITSKLLNFYHQILQG